MSRVVVVGSVNVDLVVSAPRVPAPGETILGSEVVYRPGGKGGNQAVAARRLGADTVLVAATGDDRLGEDLRDALASERLDLSRVAVTAGVATGVALIVVAADGENSIVVAPGANRLLGRTHLADLTEVLDSSTVLSLQLETPVAISLDAAALAREAGATVVLNAAPLPSTPDATLQKLLDGVDVAVLNEGEALQLAGTPAPDAPAGWARLATDLTGLGPQATVITLGSRGAVASDGERTYVRPAFAVDPVDTTGAGDGFCGALAVGLAQGHPLAESLRQACAAGALATTGMGAQAALPTGAELDRFLQHTDEGS